MSIPNFPPPSSSPSPSPAAPRSFFTTATVRAVTVALASTAPELKSKSGDFFISCSCVCTLDASTVPPSETMLFVIRLLSIFKSVRTPFEMSTVRPKSSASFCSFFTISETGRNGGSRFNVSIRFSTMRKRETFLMPPALLASLCCARWAGSFFASISFRANVIPSRTSFPVCTAPYLTFPNSDPACAHCSLFRKPFPKFPSKTYTMLSP
mmetsp:Transcript_17460/g.43488  ORF Transcript_17460/g.43488 Transcript_17460/m.43488 type:complete len:210 (-) Transcript_17460:279-908(-)